MSASERVIRIAPQLQHDLSVCGERQKGPHCRRSPSDFALISCAAAAKVGSEPNATAIVCGDCRRVDLRISKRMNDSESIGRRFNRREVKWALRSDSIEVTQYLVGLSPVDVIRLTSMMFEELRLSDLPDYLLACQEAINLVDEHEDDRREMLAEISLVVERFRGAKAVDSEKKKNLAIATYISLARASETASFLASVAEFRRGEGPSR